MSTERKSLEGRKLEVIEHVQGDLQIVTIDGLNRVFRMFHSGFGISDIDRKVAKKIVDLYNKSLDGL